MMNSIIHKSSLYIILLLLLGACQWNLPVLSPTIIDPNENFRCGDVWVDDRDDQEYSTVQIGTQCWFAENLNIGTRINVSILQTENQIIEKYCYNDQDSMCEKYGGMYRYLEAFQGDHIDEESGKTIIPNDTIQVQGICPEGWHIPAEEDWQRLELTLGIASDTIALVGYRGGSVNTGNKLKAPREGFCINPGTNCGDAGFEGLIAGQVFEDGFQNLEITTQWWTTTPWQFSDTTRFYRRGLGKIQDGINRGWGDERQGFHVRCVKD